MKSSYISLLRMLVVLGGNMKKRVVPSLLVFFIASGAGTSDKASSPRSRIIRAKPSKSSWGLLRAGFTIVRARLFSRYMPKYIPGSPEIVVQNMPGGGSSGCGQTMSIAWLNRMD